MDSNELSGKNRLQKTASKKYQHHTSIAEEPEPIQSTYTPQYSMNRTRNKYRIKRSTPSICDESLFGQPSNELPEKEWKAPWDKSRTVQPLVYDSTDRTGFYSLTKPTAPISRITSREGQRRPWK